MIEFWLSKYWPIGAITIMCLAVFISLVREEKSKNNSKERENPIVAGLRGALIAIYAFFILVSVVASMLFLYEVANEYGKTYTMVVDIHYSPNKVVRKTLVSENESFRTEYYNGSAKISGADGVYLRVNAPIEVVSNTYKQNKTK